MQASKVADRLAKIKLDEIWTSPLKRALQTTKIINEYQKVPVVQDDELREIKTPTQFVGQNKSGPHVTQAAKTFLDRRSVDPYFQFEDSEPYVDAIARTQKVLQKLTQKADQVDEKFSLGVVTHGLMLNTILLSIIMPKKIDPADMLQSRHKMWQQNTSISVVSIFKGEWRIYTIGDFATYKIIHLVE